MNENKVKEYRKEHEKVYTIRIKNENVRVYLTEEGKKRLDSMRK